ncbi:hypothetical protein [Massilia aquatica]|uniref:Uncharacterized protein n=1 Tax=Massilia aquatica TaxID=2609000 RepID=A0ABX0MD18_9BURK|nr:hypothetical protein [Massilia aquatica]NHZ45050.1 hypothetical protein [Massilia aquatica]
MAKKKQSLFEDITQIASKLPWQTSLILAIAAYVGFHYVAMMPPAPVQPGAANIAPTLTGVLLRTTSSILQYVVPIAVTLGAIVSVFKRRKQTALHNTVAATPSRAEVT